MPCLTTQRNMFSDGWVAHDTADLADCEPVINDSSHVPDHTGFTLSQPF